MSQIEHLDSEIRFNFYNANRSTTKDDIVSNNTPDKCYSNSNQNRNNCSGSSVESSVLDQPTLKMKPSAYDGSTGIGEYLTQFNIITEINGWSDQVKSLYSANSLSGNARSVLSELNERQKRDYDSLTDVLHTRYGTKNRAEIYRANLKSLKKENSQSLSELAQKVKRLTRQAYQDANSDLQKTLALDYFIDSLTHSELRLGLRECCPKNMTEAGTRLADSA